MEVDDIISYHDVVTVESGEHRLPARWFRLLAETDFLRMGHVEYLDLETAK